MYPKDADSLHKLAQLFRARRGRTVVIIADDEPPGVHHADSWRTPTAEIIPFPVWKQTR